MTFTQVLLNIFVPLIVIALIACVLSIIGVMLFLFVCNHYIDTGMTHTGRSDDIE